ncbi:MAG: SDR family NAD(P)-dependent oxidoreductase [Algoriphagus sp.]|nr:SDR family NAD(P)-dependent oxidoreductase [Algoriphagus sp.]
MKPYKNACVVVTGAGSGIGLELVRQLYPYTKNLLVIDYLPEHLDRLREEFPDIEGMILADLSQKEGNAPILEWIQTNWKGVDFCFANAGKASYAPAADQNWANMEQLFQLNVHSPIQLGLALKQCFPECPLRHVITCSAIAYWAIPGYSLYSSTKAALFQWADCLWAERDGDWLTLVFPIATTTAFFEAAGPNIPRAFPIQSPQKVAKSMLTGAARGKKKIFPSTLFKSMLLLNRLLFVLQPLATALEYRKFKNWVSSKNAH